MLLRRYARRADIAVDMRAAIDAMPPRRYATLRCHASAAQSGKIAR